MNNNSTPFLVIITLLVLVIGVLVYDNNRHKSPGEKIGEAIEQVGDDIQDSAH